jgi:hypothetical protein
MATRLIAACTVAALLTAPTQAFEVAKPFSVNGSKFLECSIVRTQPRDRDSDPVYKINVSIVFNNSGSFEALNAVHTVRSGQTYDRTQQYVNGRAWAKPGYLDWFWEGWQVLLVACYLKCLAAVPIPEPAYPVHHEGLLAPGLGAPVVAETRFRRDFFRCRAFGALRPACAQHSSQS